MLVTVTRMSRFLRIVERSSLGVGGLALVYVLGTLAYAELLQRSPLEYDDRTAVDAAYRPADKSPVVTDAARPEATGELRRGDRVARLEIPRLDLSVAVLHGVEPENLRVGAGHVPGTPLPGAEGNSVVAAHRDTHFRRLEHIQVGDRLQVSRPRGTFEFVVESTEIVEPDETSVLETRRAGSDLTLITCYPFRFAGAAPQRFVVHARRLSL